MKTAISFVMSAHPTAWHNSAPNGQVFINFDVEHFTKKVVEEVQVSL
jgi:hypothetical protein